MQTHGQMAGLSMKARPGAVAEGIGEGPLAGGFCLIARASVRSMAPSPRPAYRTARTVFPQPAFGQEERQQATSLLHSRTG